MPLNDNASPVAMKAIFKRMTFNDATYDKLVDKEGLTTLEKYRKCSVDCCKDTIKALRHPGGNLAGETVSANAAHNLSMGYHVLNIWESTHRHGKSIADVKTNADLFDVAERQAVSEKNKTTNSILTLRLVLVGLRPRSEERRVK